MGDVDLSVMWDEVLELQRLEHRATAVAAREDTD